ncbi:hypothetical protein EDB83DRAFT_70636 [Lactarius deliciosus]|nr:hypothetical protein EDB83DRAFT_70636 [Lactarius deliciosus]
MIVSSVMRLLVPCLLASCELPATRWSHLVITVVPITGSPVPSLSSVNRGVVRAGSIAARMPQRRSPVWCLNRHAQRYSADTGPRRSTTLGPVGTRYAPAALRLFRLPRPHFPSVPHTFPPQLKHIPPHVRSTIRITSRSKQGFQSTKLTPSRNLGRSKKCDRWILRLLFIPIIRHT